MGIMPLASFRAEACPGRPAVIVGMMASEIESEVETGIRTVAAFVRCGSDMEGDLEVEVEVPESEHGLEYSGEDNRRHQRIEQDGQSECEREKENVASARREGFEAARQECMEIYMEMRRQAVLARGQDSGEVMVRAEGVLERRDSEGWKNSVDLGATK